MNDGLLNIPIFLADQTKRLIEAICEICKTPKAPGFGGYDSLFTFSKSMQDQMQKDYDAKWTTEQRKRPSKEDINFKVPTGYDDHLDHFTNFFDAIRTGKKVVEDAEFGFRAAVPALACNESYLTKKIIKWDPVNMKLIK
jgi:hypothetical protein